MRIARLFATVEACGATFRSTCRVSTPSPVWDEAGVVPLSDDWEGRRARVVMWDRTLSGRPVWVGRCDVPLVNLRANGNGGASWMDLNLVTRGGEGKGTTRAAGTVRVAMEVRTSAAGRDGSDGGDGGVEPGDETVDETVAETDGDDVPMTLALAYEFTGHHRAGLTRPKSITRAVFVFDGNKKRDGPIEKSSGDADWNVLENDDDDDDDDDDARVVTPGEQSRAVSLYRRGRGRGFEEATRERRYPRLGECVSRGDVGFDPTAVFSLGAPWNRRGESSSSSSSSSFGWSLALANKGEIRVYEPVREGGGVGASAGG